MVARQDRTGEQPSTLDPPQDPDHELVLGLQSGDPQAAEELVKKHAPRFYRTARRLMSSEADIEEVVQDTLIAIWRHARSFSGRSTFSTWSTRIAINSALQRRRKLGRRIPETTLEPETDSAPLAVPIATDAASQPEQTLLQNELSQRLRECMQDLPAPMRVAVTLKDIEGLQLEACATLEGITLMAFKSRLHRARLVLRKCLLPFLSSRQGEVRR